MGKKITLIGAGSIVFTKGLLADMIKTFEGDRWILALVDTDNGALSAAKGLCKKMISMRNSDIELICTTERCDVLSGSDYVVTTIGVGGRRAWEQDVFVPRKYGVYQPVGDSIMPGGISRGLRMIPSMLDIVKDVERLCPKAIFFNYANPMTMICRAIKKANGFPVIGLCHGVTHTESYLANFAGLERSKVSSIAVGLNHLTFIYDFRFDGEDARPLLKSKYLDSKADRSELDERFCWELFDTYSAFPAPGDRHVTEFYADRYKEKESYYGKTLGEDAYSFEQTIFHGDKEFSEMRSLAASPDELPDSFHDYFAGEHEQIMSIIHSIEHDERYVYSVNMPNNGVVSNLPSYAVIEAPGVAMGSGIMPIQITDFPDILAGIISKHAAIAEIGVDAALTGSKDLFVEAILMGGYLTDKDIAANMVNELIQVHAQYLPQF